MHGSLVSHKHTHQAPSGTEGRGERGERERGREGKRERERERGKERERERESETKLKSGLLHKYMTGLQWSNTPKLYCNIVILLLCIDLYLCICTVATHVPGH